MTSAEVPKRQSVKCHSGRAPVSSLSSTSTFPSRISFTAQGERKLRAISVMESCPSPLQSQKKKQVRVQKGLSVPGVRTTRRPATTGRHDKSRRGIAHHPFAVDFLSWREAQFLPFQLRGTAFYRERRAVDMGSGGRRVRSRAFRWKTGDCP